MKSLYITNFYHSVDGANNISNNIFDFNVIYKLDLKIN